MYKVFLFAGTTEGRQIAEFLKTQSIPACVFTATAYGSELIRQDASEPVRVKAGRLDRDAMEQQFREAPGAVVIDATHPYAVEVSDHLKSAAKTTGNPYWRVLRSQEAADDWRARRDVYTVSSVAEAVSFLEQTHGNILLTTGSKNLRTFANLTGFRSRVYARILSVPESLALGKDAGLPADHLICMQGPFGEEMNCACIRHTDAAWLVTKETGTAGGFLEKLDAAKACGCSVLVITRPEETEGMSPEGCQRRLAERFPDQIQTDSDRQLRAAVIGTGVSGDLTLSAAAWLRGSDLVIGAARIVASIPRELIRSDARVVREYRADVIRELLRSSRDCRQAALLFSGDPGFYSGAAAFAREIQTGTMKCFPGVSSLSAFSAAGGISWEQVKIISIHGRSTPVLSHVRRNRQVFCLLGKPGDAGRLCALFAENGLKDLKIRVGEDLGTERERVVSGFPEELTELITSPIAVMLIENPAAEQAVVPGIPDDSFVRGKVPMTKEEIRTLAVSKLKLNGGDILWDIGAGTGSISVEAARMLPDGMVYAIEENPEGTALIRKNSRNFHLDNIEVVEGHAPEALNGLPAPDAALIGGSKGTIAELLAVLFARNPRVRVVITAITPETVSSAIDALQKQHEIDPEIIQVTVARARTVGTSHLMMGQNPVYLISCAGSGQYEEV